jgi:hypothetical protein
MTISFSYVYLNGLLRRIVSSPRVTMSVHRPSRATSPRMTGLGASDQPRASERRSASRKLRSALFIRIVSAMSSALWPVTMWSTPSCAAPRSSACRRKTPQKVPGPAAECKGDGCQIIEVAVYGVVCVLRPPTMGRTVVLFADCRDDPVHRPAVQVVVAQNLERELVLLLVPLDRLERGKVDFRTLSAEGSPSWPDEAAQARGRSNTDLERVVSVAGDALVDRQQKEVQAVRVAVVEDLHDMCEHGRVCGPGEV